MTQLEIRSGGEVVEDAYITEEAVSSLGSLVSEATSPNGQPIDRGEILSRLVSDYHDDPLVLYSLERFKARYVTPNYSEHQNIYGNAIGQFDVLKQDEVLELVACMDKGIAAQQALDQAEQPG